MEKEHVIREYAKLGINSQNELYNFMLDNEAATVFETKYNLKNSNESIEFMACFLCALGFEVTRLFFEKKKNKNGKSSRKNYHWFLAIKSEIKWYYYETTIEALNGQYTFENYKNLTNFAVTNLINEFEKNNSTDCDKLYEKYTLKEIETLMGTDLKDNVSQSEDGTEILVWNDLVGDFTYEQFITQPKQKNMILHRKRKSTSFGLFLVGFSFTLVICLIILWFLASFFTGNK